MSEYVRSVIEKFPHPIRAKERDKKENEKDVG